MGVPFTVAAPTLKEERLDASLPLSQALEKLALAKACSVAETAPEAVVLGADTIVCKDGQLLGKPANAADAVRMLRALSGQTHEVITAVALCCKASGAEETAHALSRVTFRTLSETEIAAYVAGGEPLDKAGAYGIQGDGGRFVAALEGDYDNVVGLPTACVKALLKKWKVAGI